MSYKNVNSPFGFTPISSPPIRSPLIGNGNSQRNSSSHQNYNQPFNRNGSTQYNNNQSNSSNHQNYNQPFNRNGSTQHNNNHNQSNSSNHQNYNQQFNGTQQSINNDDGGQHINHWIDYSNSYINNNEENNRNKRRKTNKKDIYSHQSVYFEQKLITKIYKNNEKGELSLYGTCNFCEKEMLLRNGNGAFSTGNVSKHFKESECGKNTEFYNENLSKNELQNKKFNKILMEYIIDSYKPFNMGENVYFKRLLASVSGNLTPNLSGDYIKETMEKYFHYYEKYVKILISNIKSKKSFSIDVVSKKGHSFLGIAIHFIDDEGYKRDLLLSFVPFSYPHTGERMAQLFYNKVVIYFGIKPEDILAITHDGGSNNKTFRDYLLQLLPPNMDIVFIYCLAHIVNLLTKLFLKHLPQNKRYDPFSNDELKELYIQTYGTNIEPEQAPSIIHQFNEMDINEFNGTIFEKCRFVVKFINSHPILVQLLERLQGIDKPLKLKFYFEVRWGTSKELIGRLIQLRQFIECDEFLAQVELKLKEKKSEIGISSFKFTDDEWQILFTIFSILVKFDEITKIQSLSSSNLDCYFANCNQIFDFLESLSIKYPTFNVSFREAGNLVKSYYGITDQKLEYYVMATMLNNCLRLETFSKNSSTWNNDQIIKFKEIFIKNYLEYKSKYGEDSRISKISSINNCNNISYNQRLFASSNYYNNNIDNNNNNNNNNIPDEVYKYLSFPINKDHVDRFADPFQFYRSDEGKLDYPIIGLMSRDFLSIQSSSVFLERSFSALPDIVTLNRGSLTSPTISLIILSNCYQRFLHKYFPQYNLIAKRLQRQEKEEINQMINNNNNNE